MLVLLDSTVLIDGLRGRPAAERITKLAATDDVPCTSAINVEEVVRGLRSEEIETARRLFDGLFVLPVTEPEAWLAGTWRRDHASKGATLSQPDCLVAACAAVNGATLATGNPAHFPMEEVRVEHWPVGG